jgi:hypothetical protein
VLCAKIGPVVARSKPVISKTIKEPLPGSGCAALSTEAGLRSPQWLATTLARGAKIDCPVMQDSIEVSLPKIGDFVIFAEHVRMIWPRLHDLFPFMLLHYRNFIFAAPAID